MYLCLCFAVSDSLVREYIQANAPVSLDDLQKLCQAGTGCGSCLCELEKLLRQSKEQSPHGRPPNKDND